MELMTLFMFIMMVIGASFAIWLNTKSGKKWLANL